MTSTIKNQGLLNGDIEKIDIETADTILFDNISIWNRSQISLYRMVWLIVALAPYYRYTRSRRSVVVS